MKNRPNADPEAAGRKLLKIPITIEPIQDGRVHIEEDQRTVPVPMAAARLNTARASRLALETRIRHLRKVYFGRGRVSSLVLRSVAGSR